MIAVRIPAHVIVKLADVIREIRLADCEELVVDLPEPGRADLVGLHNGRVAFGFGSVHWDAS